MSEDDNIRARFVSAEDGAAIFIKYRDVFMTIRYKLSEDCIQQVSKLVGNLPDLLSKGYEEIYVQEQARKLELELEDFLQGDEGKGSE